MTRAAGGLLWRPGEGSGRAHRRVCLIHRDRYDDWSLPKGKLHPGEHPLAAAVREVSEETGWWAVPQLPLSPTRYLVSGVVKQVDYWAMTVVAAGPPRPPDSEVDELVWLPIPAAFERLTYRHDIELLKQWSSTPPITGTVLLVRHADAGSRAQWPAAADALRPLSPRGSGEAQALCRLLELCAPTRLVSASPRRCRQTLLPLAQRRRLPVTVDPVFDEATGDPAAAAQRLLGLAGTGATTVVCSQGAVIPPLLAHLSAGSPLPARLAGDDREPAAATALRPARSGPQTHETGRSEDWTTAKGDGWFLPFSGPLPIAAAPLRLADGAVLG